jgi:DMSO/TMAO reductase YedYZ molybdopterin-dependent catalytic subunit
MAAMGAGHALLSGAAEQDGLVVPGEDRMIVRSLRFLDLEMPMEYLDSWITPVPHFFVRNHMHEPSILEAAEWRLSIGGEVERPFALTLAELRKLPLRSVTDTLECAGNGWEQRTSPDHACATFSSGQE